MTMNIELGFEIIFTNFELDQLIRS